MRAWTAFWQANFVTQICARRNLEKEIVDTRAQHFLQVARSRVRLFTGKSDKHKMQIKACERRAQIQINEHSRASARPDGIRTRIFVFVEGGGGRH